MKKAPSTRLGSRRALSLRAMALVGVLVIAIPACSSISGKSTDRQSGHAPSRSGKASKANTPAISAIEAGVLPWSLRAPLSREVVLPGPGTTLSLVGGLESGGQSASGVFSLDVTSGTLATQGVLAAGVHDAAGLEIGGQGYVVGGGSPTTVATVTRIIIPQLPPGYVATNPSSSATTTSPAQSNGATPFSSQVSSLPQPRSDAVGVTIGNTGYIVGGYDGTSSDPEVLATSDGIHFSDVASLPDPVRYPAVAAIGAEIYVFGGELIGGPSSGNPTDLIQQVDTSSHRAKIIGHLSSPLEGAIAVVLGGNIYIAGGDAAANANVSPASSGSATGSASSAGTIAGSATSPSAPSLPVQTTGTIWAFDPATNSVLNAGSLPDPVAYAGASVVQGRAWIIGGEANGAPVGTVEMMIPNPKFGTAGVSGAGSPYFGGKLLVADRGNNRLLLLDDNSQITWQYPSPSLPPPTGGFYFPDDAFFIKGGTAIISNQEQNETIVEIAYPSGKIIWSYGHPGQKGSAPGFLSEPDDAYLLKNGQITVADAYNCRILFINPDGTVGSQIGTNGACTHNPPNDIGTPNGDTPLQNGDVLVSEINGSWVSEYTPQGSLVWTVHLPIAYPSDPQQIGPNLYLISDYTQPGAILEFNSQGQILYQYRPKVGSGVLNQPSLTELLPSGVFMSNDDFRDRVVAIDPTTQAMVWQYGVTDKAGTAPGMLNTPDGFDILMPDGTTPTHPYTG